MAGIASQNRYDLLDDDAADSSQAPAVGKNTKTAKGDKQAAAKPARVDERASRNAGRPRNDGSGGNEAAFRDRGAGSQQNRTRDTESRGEYRGRGRGRGGRGRGGSRGGAALDDRHSKSGVVDHEKQVGHGWGQNTGSGEWADEQAGEAIAKEEGKVDAETAATERNGDADAEPVEEGPKSKTLDDYLAEQAEKRLQVSNSSDVRKANEGLSKKFPVGKEFSREDEEEDFIAGTGGKKNRERVKKEKNLLELDGEAMRQTDRTSERRGGRGGGGGAGGSGRGRGSDYPQRGSRGGRDYRGSERGRGRGGRGGSSNAPNVSDESAFPSLGA